MDSLYGKGTGGMPWVTFCMSTYKRPSILKRQLKLLAEQTFSDFQVVISDNDPEKSGKTVVEEINDSRMLYYANEANLGMIRSFNKSLERASSEFVIMITDDDPVSPDMLMDFRRIMAEYPGFSIYCGCTRTGKKEGAIEVFGKDEFVFQLLHPRKTSVMLWSSCILKKSTAIHIGGMPDYGSPHLADHAMLALCSRETGGVMINRIYSKLSSHDQNFSKSNFELYYTGCIGFYDLIVNSFREYAYKKGKENALLIHLENWLIGNAFKLKKYFSFQRPDKRELQEIRTYLNKLIQLPYMSSGKFGYRLKQFVFVCKSPLYYVKYRILR